MSRSFADIAANPLSGDAVEIREPIEGDASWTVMLRVLAVKEEYVWYKQYGKGRCTMHVKAWRERLLAAGSGAVLQEHSVGCTSHPLWREVQRLKAEVERLKAEVERLKPAEEPYRGGAGWDVDG